LHGERLTPVQLELFFQQLPEASFAYNAHDQAKPPVAKGYNKRLERLPNGVLALVLDIEVLDEEAFGQAGGFSIAYTRRTARVGSGEPSFRILINPQQFDFDALVEAVTTSTSIDVTVDVTERVEKAEAGQAAFIILAVLLTDAVRETWRGYWNAAGSSLFEHLRKLPRKDKPGGTTNLRLQIDVALAADRTQVILFVEPEVRAGELAELDLASIRGAVEAVNREQSLDKLIGRVQRGPRIEYEYSIDRTGTVNQCKKNMLPNSRLGS